jgi:lysophospholipase L1-like esterase
MRFWYNGGELRVLRAAPLLALSGLLASCGSGSHGPDPVPTPTPGTPVTGVVFYDENANGVLDPNEVVRLPGVMVQIGGSSAQSAAGGVVTVASVPSGAQSASLRPDGLPAYFTAGAQVAVTAPQPSGSSLYIPATLATGGNRPRSYMAFGDSITFGDGSKDGSGYRNYLAANLANYWGGSHNVINEGVSATTSNKGESRMGPSLSRDRPAYTLILYGTNDWNECRGQAPAECYTIDSLRSMIIQAKEVHSFPILATVPPVNPAFVDKSAAERNDWVKRQNDSIRALGKEQQVQMADVYDAFTKAGNLSGLFADDKHPNEAGYVLMAQVWFKAITQPLGASTSGRRPTGFFARPGAGF